MRDKGPFRFKMFNCSHSRSSMKIGIDAVLLGAWTDVEGASRILEVGCGCGVISLMLAQRTVVSPFPPMIEAIDIHLPSVEEASENFCGSPWNGRLSVRQRDFLTMMPGIPEARYDLIVSNPPYFDSGIESPDTPRLKARHQAALSPVTLIGHGVRFLSDKGRIALVIPFSQADDLVSKARSFGLVLCRRLDIRGHEGVDCKRSLLEFGLYNANAGISGNKREPDRLMLTLEISPNVPTSEHHALCRDFYLKW